MQLARPHSLTALSPLPVHRRSTLVLCWSQLHDNSACQWVPIVLNLLVHVSMYYYYAARALTQRLSFSTTPRVPQKMLQGPCVPPASPRPAEPPSGRGCAGGDPREECVVEEVPHGVADRAVCD